MASNEPIVVAAARQFRERLLAGEANEQAAMARAWLRIERSLEGSFEATAARAAEAFAAGTPIKISWLYKMARYTALVAQVRDELRSFEQDTARSITSRQRTLVEAGIDDAASLIRLTGLDASAFFRLPVSAVETMAGLAGDGSPLVSLLSKSLFTDAVTGITNALITATARGKNPRDTASEMAAGSRLGLQRALTIARTEQLRAYREASRSAYASSGVVQGFRRLATKDERTCIACLVADGEVYETDTPLRAHVQCRCATVPIVRGLQPVRWETGANWLQRQDEETQRAIMGKGRFELYQSGAIELNQLATVVHNETWGSSTVPTPLNAL